MNVPFSNIEQLADIFFNGRPAAPKPAPPPSDTKVTVAELVRRKSSVIRIDGRLYRVKVTEVELI